MDPSPSYLAPFLAEHYGAVKARFPGEGRRIWRLRVAEMFWNLSPEQKNAYLSLISQNAPSAQSIEDADFSTDDDPFDALSDDALGIGILLRTDYTNEDAWQVFHARLQEAEAEYAAAAAAADEDLPTEGNTDPAAAPHEAPSAAQGAAATSKSVLSPSTGADGDTAMVNADDADDDDDDAADADEPVFAVVNAPPSSSGTERARLADLSNLAALRLLADVDVRRAPAPPAGTRRLRPPNRLVEHDGWQEVYAGKGVWVYDARSNEDQCVRLVSHAGAAMYGTATGDSWRARVSHICELQVNLAAGAMTIDFGGMDRWDYVERTRNMEEAVRPVT